MQVIKVQLKDRVVHAEVVRVRKHGPTVRLPDGNIIDRTWLAVVEDDATIKQLQESVQ